MISILMPIYNGIEFIEESVSSILNQTYDQWELIIGINGHDENSDVYKIAKEYEKRSVKAFVYDFYKITGKSNTIYIRFLYLFFIFYILFFIFL